MPSCWKYFCCVCVREREDDQSETSYRRRMGKRRRKRDYTPSGSGTWARQTLLDNEQTEYHHLSYHKRFQQGPGNSTGELAQFEYPNSVTKLLDKQSCNQRPKAQDIFTGVGNTHSEITTTFPWMDENFRSRPNTHLGVSSVQINARRNEIAHGVDQNPTYHVQQKPHHDVTNSYGNQERQFITNTYAKQYDLYNGPARITYAQNNNFTGTDSNGVGHKNYTIRDERSSKPTPTTRNFDSPPERRLILTAPKTSVGVRRVNSGAAAYVREHRIPKLQDLQESQPAQVQSFKHAGNTYAPNSDARQQAETTLYRTPIDQAVYRHNSNASSYSYKSSNISNVKYGVRGNITRKIVSRNNSNSSEFSLKRHPEPGIYTRNPQRTHSVKSLKLDEKQTKPPHRVESMYEYKPKAMQDVYASTALEGNKLDDFFMQCLNQSELDKFGAVDTAEKEERIQSQTVTAETSFSITSPTISQKNVGPNVDRVYETVNNQYQIYEAIPGYPRQTHASGNHQPRTSASRPISHHMDDYYNKPRVTTQMSADKTIGITQRVVPDINHLNISNRHGEPYLVNNAAPLHRDNTTETNSQHINPTATTQRYIPTHGGKQESNRMRYSSNSERQRSMDNAHHTPSVVSTNVVASRRYTPNVYNTGSTPDRYMPALATADQIRTTPAATDMQSRAISVLSKRSDASIAASFLESTEVFY